MSTRSQKPTSDNTNQELISTIVAHEKRMDFLPLHFGRLSLAFEFKVYGCMEYFCADYRGGYWEFRQLSNGGPYMVPKMDTSFHIVNPMNHYEGDMSADATGIAVCCHALSLLSFEFTDTEVFVERFYQLRDYGMVHSEIAEIMRLLD
jgi:hypothetical protein